MIVLLYTYICIKVSKIDLQTNTIMKKLTFLCILLCYFSFVYPQCKKEIIKNYEEQLNQCNSDMRDSIEFYKSQLLKESSMQKAYQDTINFYRVQIAERQKIIDRLNLKTEKSSNVSTSKPVKTSSYSSVCGARTKKGGYCQRKVSGGGRCWQH